MEARKLKEENRKMTRELEGGEEEMTCWQRRSARLHLLDLLRHVRYFDSPASYHFDSAFRKKQPALFYRLLPHIKTTDRQLKPRHSTFIIHAHKLLRGRPVVVAHLTTRSKVTASPCRSSPPSRTSELPPPVLIPRWRRPDWMERIASLWPSQEET